MRQMWRKKYHASNYASLDRYREALTAEELRFEGEVLLFHVIPLNEQ